MERIGHLISWILCLRYLSLRRFRLRDGYRNRLAISERSRMRSYSSCVPCSSMASYKRRVNRASDEALTRLGMKGSDIMKIGIAMFPTDYSITPSDLGQAVEERGFESLWFPEHTHIPTSRKSPWPGGPNLPDVYKQLDPFMPLTAAAVATKRIKLATGICLVVERDPIRDAGPPALARATSVWQ